MKIVVRAGERREINFLRTSGEQEDLQVELVGAGASVKITHIVLGNGKEKSDIKVAVYHKAPETESEVIIRSAVNDQAQLVYRGLIDMAEEARGAKGYQSGKGLLLNRGAVVDILPELKIRNNDVRCSHGVTTTHLDDLALFYLRSRGLDEFNARRLAVLGFLRGGLDLPAEISQRLGRVI